MAAFCTKCGSTMPSNTGFCPACGTPAGAGSAAPQPGFTPVPVPVAVPVAQAPPTPPAPAAYPQSAPGYAQVNTGGAPPPAGYPPAAAYPPPAKSSGVLKIILIVIAVLVFLVVLVVGGIWFMAWRVSRSIHLDNKGNGTISVMGSTISAGKDINISADDLGVPLYPGATRAEGGMHMSLPTGSMVSAIYTTDDPVTTVVAFYKGKLGDNESDIDTDNGSVLSSGKQGMNGKSGTVITVGPGSGDKSGKTQISIVHTVSNQ